MQFSVEMELHANRMISFFPDMKIVWLAFFIFLLLSREEDCQIKNSQFWSIFFYFQLLIHWALSKHLKKHVLKVFCTAGKF